MNQKSKAAFLALVLLQALHSLEEYSFGFFEVFPPARLLDEIWPGVAQPGFIGVNVALVAFGLWCFFWRIQPEAPTARRWAWLWVIIEAYNGIAHPIWAAAIHGYNPGLASAPFLLALSLYLAFQLHTSARGVSTQAFSWKAPAADRQTRG